MECINDLCTEVRKIKGLKLNINNVQLVAKNLIILLINNEKYKNLYNKKQIILDCLYKLLSNSKDKNKHNKQIIDTNSNFIENESYAAYF